MQLQSGLVLDGKYTLESKLGEGGFGVVYRATQLSTGRTVAVKCLKPAHLALLDAESRLTIIARFEREMQLVAKLDHPHIVALLDMGGSTVEGAETPLYAVFTYINGLTLSDYLKDNGGLSVYETRRLMLQVLEALAYAHTLKIVHRDVKPDNIMLTGTTQKYAHVLDFGIAGVRDVGYQTLTQHGELLGTPAYMAPEQIRDIKNAGCPADLYAWGLVYLECLTGQRVARGDTKWEMLSFHADAAPISIPEEFINLPDFQWVFWALNKNPAHRPADASALLSHISAFLLLESESAKEASRRMWMGDAVPTLRRQRRWLFKALANLTIGIRWLVVKARANTGRIVFVAFTVLVWLYLMWLAARTADAPLRRALPAKQPSHFNDKD